MKTTNERVYRCEHCNRAIVSKGSMTLHERMCKKNPNNQHQCFKYCKYLVKEVNVDIENESEIGTMFTCTKKHIEMHSYKLERYSMNSRRVSQLTRMPLNCEHYKVMDGHNFYPS